MRRPSAQHPPPLRVETVTIPRMQPEMCEEGRQGHAAESRRIAAIERAIATACPGRRVDFAAAREAELARARLPERSALRRERERRRNRQ